MNVLVRDDRTYSPDAHRTFEEIDKRVTDVYSDVCKWRGWELITNPATETDKILSLTREIFLAVHWYQKHTTEAGFHMLGRLPKGEVQLIRSLCSHKAEEAEHGFWAFEDYLKLGGCADAATRPSSAATFAVSAVWWRMAQIGDPFGYLGAEYLFEQLTVLVTRSAMPIIRNRGLPREGLRFVLEHAEEDPRHAAFLRHITLDVATRYPESGAAMLRCLNYFRQVYPLPVWDEAYDRAVS
jgi:hypothetical protein